VPLPRRPFLRAAAALLLPLQALTAQSLPVPLACPAPDSNGLLVYFLDVGQGDAILLRGPDGRDVLVDAGEPKSVAADALRLLRVQQLDLVVISHYHHDHIGGLPEVFNAVRVANVLENGLPATSQSFQRTLAAMETEGSRVLSASARTITVGEMAIQVLPPSPRPQSQNLASVGVIARYGAFQLLLTGDAETETIDWWTAPRAIPAVTVVKAGHHGSRNATTRALVDATRPEMVVISAGTGNSYGHPHPEALARWSGRTRRILRTDLEGTIAMRGCRDGTFRVRSARGTVATGGRP
jgi:beta-lactamase superfamily II metal-dependent hydrolase